MLRNHSGWAWRFVAFLFLLFLYGPTVRGAPLLGLPPIRPVIPSKPYTPSSYSISGYVYDDFSDQGVKLPGDAGLAAVQITLLQYSSTGTQSFTTFTNSAGYYDFGNLTAGDSYNIQETQPTYFTTTADNLGYFQGASGGTLTVPPPASNGSPAPPNGFSGITFAPISTGVYSAVNYNFGESPTDFPLYGVPGKPYIPGGAAPGPSATFSTSLSLVGNNDRFLAGPGAGSLDLSATVSNTAAAGSGGLNWGTSPSSGAGFTPASYTNQAPGTALTLTGSVNGANLSSGTQNATLTVSGRIGSNGKLTSATASVLIDPVYSRGIDSVSTANLGRIMAGATTLPQTVTVTSAGAYLNYSNLTMNGGATAGTTDANGNYSVVNGAATTFDGTTTTNSGVAFSAQFASSLSGTISSTAAIPGNTGLFTGETLAAGTPALPTLNVPYTATVLQQRQLAPATGTSTSPLTVSTTGGGFLFGAVVPVSGYSVMSNTDSNHTTSVYVTGSANAIFGILAGDGVTVVPYSPATSIGQVFVTQQTLVNSAGVTSVPLAISLQNLGPYFGIAGLNVVTAEQASVKDPGGYAPVSFTYQVSNVGYAATGGSDSTGAQLFGAPLSATFPAGSSLATFNPALVGSNSYTGVTLTSLVASAGTAGANSTTTGYNGTTLTDPYNPTSNVKGTVGSQCDILDSTALTTTANVSMSWRNRNAVENGSLVLSATEKLPPGVKWLVSDVVDVAGIPSGTTYAMEMTFDDGINSVLEGTSRPTTISGSYLAKLVTTGSVSVWENAALTLVPGGLAETGVADTLTDFLATEYADHPGLTHDELLADLAGSWGVDLVPGGVGTSWAILNNGGGEFAVVPEPSTFALLGAGIVVLLLYRARRRRLPPQTVRNAPAPCNP
jgi:hypothetical protein